MRLTDDELAELERRANDDIYAMLGRHIDGGPSYTHAENTKRLIAEVRELRSDQRLLREIVDAASDDTDEDLQMIWDAIDLWDAIDRAREHLEKKL